MTILVARKKTTTEEYNGFILIDDGRSYMNLNPTGTGREENYYVV